MAIYRKFLRAGANPGANLGAVFTSSFPETEFTFDGAYLSQMVLSFKGDAGAAVTMENFLDLVNPLVVKAGSEPIVQMRGRDLYAMSAAFLKHMPDMIEATQNGEDCKVSGIRIPLWLTKKPNTTYTYSVTRAAVTNISGEVLTLAVESHDKPFRRPVKMVEIAATTQGSTGAQSIREQLPRDGDLLGILVFLTGVEDLDDDTGSVNHITLRVNDVKRCEYGLADASLALGGCDDALGKDALRNYRFIDLSEDPIDCLANKVGIEVDVQGTSEAIRFIPVYQLPA